MFPQCVGITGSRRTVCMVLYELGKQVNVWDAPRVFVNTIQERFRRETRMLQLIM